MSYSSRRITGLRRATGLAALATVMALTVTACGPDDNSGASAVAGDDGGKDADVQKAEALKDAYRGVLGGLNTADFEDPEGVSINFTGNFEYTTADLNADKAPELLVKAVGKEFSPIRVYSATEDGTLITPAKFFYEGASSAGGARGAVYTASDSSGLLQDDWMGGTGEATSTLWTLDGSEMAESGQDWDYRIGQIPSDLTALQTKITWISTDDSSAIDSLVVGGAGEDAASGDGPQPRAVGRGELSSNATAPSSQIGGNCGTVDGATITAGSVTSCGFAMNVAKEALSTTWGPDTVSPADANGGAGITTVTATSPSTSTTYTMNCMIGSGGGTANCTGGNNAQVRIEKPGNSSLLYLVDENVTPGASSGQGQQPAPDTTVDGQTVLTGTVVDMTTSEIMDISETAPGSPPPNGEPETNGYIVLKLDRPQQITARHSGMSGQTAERTVRYVSVSTPNGSESSINWTGYVGKHVTVTTTAEGMWFPSDTGLPLGMVRLSGGTVK